MEEQAYRDLLNALPALEPKGACWVLRERKGEIDTRCRIVNVARMTPEVIAQAPNWATLARLFEV
jgi:hypothetical protein